MKNIKNNISKHFGIKRLINECFILKDNKIISVLNNSLDFDYKINNIEGEIWKIIDGYKKYEISNYGRVMSISYNNTGIKKLLKAHLDKDGYYRVSLRTNGRAKTLFIHRLVAQAFIPNPNNKESVNHIDGNHTNNMINNLEWLNMCEQHLHACRVLGKIVKSPSKGKFGKDHPKSRKIDQYSLDNILIKEWGSISDASRTLKIKDYTIGKCCQGKRKSGGGFIWKYHEEK